MQLHALVPGCGNLFLIIFQAMGSLKNLFFYQ
jgi:hypothetical protein